MERSGVVQNSGGFLSHNRMDDAMKESKELVLYVGDIGFSVNEVYGAIHYYYPKVSHTALDFEITILPNYTIRTLEITVGENTIRTTLARNSAMSSNEWECHYTKGTDSIKWFGYPDSEELKEYIEKEVKRLSE